MRKKLLNLSGKIEQSIIEVLAKFNEIANSYSIQFFVVGAIARDIILTHGYDIPVRRLTQDIDFGVQISNWKWFDKLKNGLIETGYFSPTKVYHRLEHKNGRLIDIVPFGEISGVDNVPTNQLDNVNTLGFKSSFNNAVIIRVRNNPPLDIKFASPVGLALMKIIAWDDKYPNRKKDAKDLLLLIKNYLDLGNHERLCTDHQDLLSMDYELSGARLLGRDIAKIADRKTRETILEILNKETIDQNRYRLVEDMIEYTYDEFDDFERILMLLKELKRGIEDMHSNSF